MQLESRNCVSLSNYMPAFITWKVPILGEPFLAQPNQKRAHAHKSSIRFCHDMDLVSCTTQSEEDASSQKRL